MFQICTLLVAWFMAGAIIHWSAWIAFPVIYGLLVFRGSKGRLNKACKKLQSIIMKDEKLVNFAIQNRITALLFRRELVAITSSRIIAINRPLLGGFSMRDYQWKDLHDAKLEENMLPAFFGSDLEFQIAEEEEPIRINNISSSKASEIYTYAQSEEQAWEEKHRIRALEESRAISGGVIIQAGAGQTSGGAVTTSTLDELTKAKSLFDAGAISDTEYQEIKAKVLSRA